MNEPSNNSDTADLRSPLQSELVWTGKYDEHGDRSSPMKLGVKHRFYGNSVM
ncbi:hypothetical protein [Oscillatoria sp. FACHB-1407]|uniref:hypothetical protein n=1 Tax=Oscillatoria sp. FACHB-1407 TaxID=2692847 RepID=UPI0016874207|nr:hypothetical protein [Oscillatoria sp. FACHB-1407]